MIARKYNRAVNEQAASREYFDDLTSVIPPESTAAWQTRILAAEHLRRSDDRVNNKVNKEVYEAMDYMQNQIQKRMYPDMSLGLLI